jgi:large subunit ribosomal protein L10e
MVKIRKFVAYRKMEARPNTRKSKYKGKAYNRSIPPSHMVKFDLGNLQKQDFEYIVGIATKQDCQIRSNALESARTVLTRHLELSITVSDYHIQARCYPHHILRENPLATGAGADRLSTGMSAAFGIAHGVAVRAFAGKILFAVYCNKTNLEVVKAAVMKAKYKVPCSCRLVVTENEHAKASA